MISYTSIWGLTLILFLANSLVLNLSSVSTISCLNLNITRPYDVLSKTEEPVNQVSDVLNPYPGKARLTFKPDGTFKLTVFSDLHFGENPWDAWGPQQDVNSIALMRTVLGDEKPDYV
jgi:hypothetical protein